MGEAAHLDEEVVVRLTGPAADIAPRRLARRLALLELLVDARVGIEVVGVRAPDVEVPRQLVEGGPRVVPVWCTVERSNQAKLGIGPV